MKQPSDLIQLNLEFKLTDRQRAVMASAVQQEPFTILQNIMEDEVRRFHLNLMNTPVNKREDVLANHLMAKVAGMFYAGLIKRLEEEVQIATYQASGVGTIDNPETLPLPEEFI